MATCRSSWFLRRTGQTLGHQDDTLRLLRAGELVLVFPEGIRGTGKPWSERYRLRRFGRGGFVEVAMRAGAPIIPVSVVGSEETYPMLADIRGLAQLLGMPYFPITPTWPLLGPLGLLPLPSKWLITFHAPVNVTEPVELTTQVSGQRHPAHDGHGADQLIEPGRVMELADTIRTTIQAGIVDDLMRRARVFRG